jgi:hypothetical protein
MAAVGSSQVIRRTFRNRDGGQSTEIQPLMLDLSTSAPVAKTGTPLARAR